MADQNDILKSARDIVSNMEDLVSDIENLDEHEHDTWQCSDCESMVDEQLQDKIGDLDVNDLMDANYNLWQEIGEEAVGEYRERTEAVTLALDELAHRVLGLYSTVESTDVDTVAMAIDYITEIVYGVREERKPVPEEDIIEIALNTGNDAPQDSLTLNNNKCSCGVDHSVSNYE